MFDLEDFVENPEVTASSGLTKAQWLKLAAYYSLTLKSGQRKEEVRRIALGRTCTQFFLRTLSMREQASPLQGSSH